MLLDWSEYQRLKNYEKKYVELKKKTDKAEGLIARDQVGQGSEQELERIILTKENENENLPKQQKILLPVTTPKSIDDVGPIEAKSSGCQETEEKSPRKDSLEPATKVTENKKDDDSTPPPKKRKREPDLIPEKWFFGGFPRYKH